MAFGGAGRLIRPGGCKANPVRARLREPLSSERGAARISRLQHDGYRFRLRSLSYGGQVAPPILRAEVRK